GRALGGVDAVYLVCSPVRACRTRRQYGGCLSGSRRAPCGSELRAWSRRLSEVLPKLAPQSGRQAQGIWSRLHDSAAEQLYAEHPDVLRTHHQDPGRILCRDGECPNQLYRCPRCCCGGSKDADVAGSRRQTYELNGPEAITYAEVAEKITRAS